MIAFYDGFNETNFDANIEKLKQLGSEQYEKDLLWQKHQSKWQLELALCLYNQYILK